MGRMPPLLYQHNCYAKKSTFLANYKLPKRLNFDYFLRLLFCRPWLLFHKTGKKDSGSIFCQSSSLVFPRYFFREFRSSAVLSYLQERKIETENQN